MNTEEEEIKVALREAGVPCVDKSSIVESIKWLSCVQKSQQRRLEFITDKFGIDVIQDLSGQTIIDVGFYIGCDEERAAKIKRVPQIWEEWIEETYG